MAVKVLLSAVYMIKYWCSSRGGNTEPVINTRSRIGQMVDTFSEEIMSEVDNHLVGIKEEYVKSSRAGVSFIQAARSKKNTEKAFQNQRKEQAGRSRIIGKVKALATLAARTNLPTIEEEKYPKDKKKPQQQQQTQQVRKS
jgi:hypothetical protein